MANTWTTADPAGAQAQPRIRHITTADLRDALARGWADFQAIPTQLIFLSILYPIIGLIAARAAWGGPLMPLLWPLVSGFALVGPVAALGIYELSRRREQGLPTSWLNAFDVLRSPSLIGIVFLALMLVAIFVAWLGTARAITHFTIGPVAPDSIGDFARMVFGTPEGWRLILIGNGVGFLFAALVLMLTVVSFPLLLDRPTDPGVAIRTSVRAVLANPVPMAIWGLIVGVLLLLGSIPAFVGLAVVVPVLGHATWHLYRKLVAW
jgi:uncharacterized membrane protein